MSDAIKEFYSKKLKEVSNQDQIKSIQEIMNDCKKDIPYYRFRFGKYKGSTLEEVYRENRNYLKWIYNNIDRIDRTLEKFLQKEFE